MNERSFSVTASVLERMLEDARAEGRAETSGGLLVPTAFFAAGIAFGLILGIALGFLG